MKLLKRASILLGFIGTMSMYMGVRLMSEGVSEATRLKPTERLIKTGKSVVTKVLLATYYRGGSTFLGEVFNKNPAVFYMFEPLLVPTWKWKHDVVGFVFDSNGKPLPIPDGVLDNIADTTLKIMNCDFARVDPDILTHYFHVDWTKSTSMLPYRDCMHDSPPNLRNEVKLSNCLPKLISACENSTIRVIKTIRTPALLAKVILRRDPTIKLVHYARDPRGMVVSAEILFGRERNLQNMTYLSQESKKICARMRHDILEYSSLRKRYNILRLKYEDLSRKALTNVERLYDFIQSPIPDKTSAWISGTAISSPQITYQWRKSLTEKAFDIMDKNCRDVLSFYGYDQDPYGPQHNATYDAHAKGIF